MKKYQLAFLFTQAPFGTATAREGLDALLAASAFCDEEALAICFLGDGVFNLLNGQQPELIGQKDHISAFKLLSLYDLNESFICRQSLAERGLDHSNLLPVAREVSRRELFDVLSQAEKVLTF